MKKAHDKNAKFRTAFGRVLTEQLARNQMDQSRLANLTGRSVSSLNHYLTGRRAAGPEFVELVADTLKLPAVERQSLHIAAAKDVGYKLDLDLTKPTNDGD